MTGAFAWMTVLPMPPQAAPTREDARRIIAAVPVTGALVGTLVAAIAWGACAAGLAPLLAGALAVAGGVLVTRGMHIDALSDCADGLGTYGPPERAREVMRQGTIGAFGAAALVLVLLIEAAAITSLADDRRWLAIGVSVAVARVAAVIGCRRGWAPSNPDGFGALTAGTQGVLSIGTWIVLACAATLPVSAAPWHGPVAVLASLALATLVMRHCIRRFGGASGDVFGCGIEIACAAALVGVCF
ncbi:adenosylcobinamide-GDP ribazoletransferase [Tsukamurella sp. 8F]|uniref:adenosylcobinamide-GDP ribazoletransferase n=1 Tax=unclassified Tsukamurella TaxID=2633480 RepID=UPI0023B8A2D1|nr:MULTISPECIES: adenosylcobinamide-GDP ribazoletransferase [unclassified Tsukamurella]MDF0529913.1 adenosylcobinamide-GDP ribazoletransferase [Tsukamurella sp. 8J]MDF0587315.1 adenosylcobinamide-GDP ribazoletransferase [Tsukamurella sp. 8F]